MVKGQLFPPDSTDVVASVRTGRSDGRIQRFGCRKRRRLVHEVRDREMIAPDLDSATGRRETRAVDDRAATTDVRRRGWAVVAADELVAQPVRITIRVPQEMRQHPVFERRASASTAGASPAATQTAANLGRTCVLIFFVSFRPTVT